MDNWITRIVAILCALGSMGLFWTFGVFIVVPWREGRLLSLDRMELQATGAPLLLGLAVAWGAAHILGIADRKNNPRIYAMTCVLLLIACITATINGISWTQAKLN